MTIFVPMQEEAANAGVILVDTSVRVDHLRTNNEALAGLLNRTLEISASLCVSLPLIRQRVDLLGQSPQTFLRHRSVGDCRQSPGFGCLGAKLGNREVRHGPPREAARRVRKFLTFSHGQLPAASDHRVKFIARHGKFWLLDTPLTSV
jgi:hypothetical protein